jgi:hypothetical protein
VQTHWIVTASVIWVIAIALSLSARETKGSVNANTYSHGETTCLQGDDGHGLRLRLRQAGRCEGRVAYPYLEIDIRELPIAVRKSITIGADNLAFRCPDTNESCEQSLSGHVMFDHLGDANGKETQTDGSYELRFRDGHTESGHFNVDCRPPCG